jgi:hypothetical protein
MADEDYGDDDAFYYDDDDYLYVEDDYAIAVSYSSSNPPLQQPTRSSSILAHPKTGSQVPGACMCRTLPGFGCVDSRPGWVDFGGCRTNT